ncbi:cystathionine gamma-lyase [Polaribacter sp. Hel1_33_78]|jgi:cystathionine beta-lyase|uniref:cystathionine gamma-synthase n=1 Tax=unclassified Polaribacter TaxID=196858 RepID=UPI00087A8128|nr:MULTISPECIES: cystathionine gamma-synthase [unclassified Polaribacter]MBT3741457.1 cystathionine gamma-synthase [Polaribacter sp.]MDG1195708.1 cystathionine gamma-synthase [Polaribacter sp.]MDG1403753.1 cystathionine gamma-synthase [Polaribacter sp.]MDG2437116.1 cystathionine gamma-synthase [Polaribacter sp.]PKV63753.1 cystathionine gamma-lyase [Polaribacter sp. Hel1_33_96]
MKFNTKTIQGGQKHEEATGSVIPPIFQTSTYKQSSFGVAQEYNYSRGANPTRTALEDSFASIENGTHGFAFSSGLAAIDCVLRTLNPGDEVIAGNDLYGGTYRMFTQLFQKYGLEFTYVDIDSGENILKEITERTKLVWLETPTNPLMKIADIEAICSAVKEVNVDILIAVDNTFATPYLQRPLDLGADIVMHSVTKYLGGHSDLLMGALIVKEAKLADELNFIQFAAGAIAGPMDSFLALRGIKTLHVRMQRHCENASAVASFLKKNPKIGAVYYPGLEDHPNHEVAKKQMKDFGGVVSFRLKDGSREATFKFLESIKFFTLAESLGGVESMVNHSATMSHASMPEEARLKIGITDSLIRLSVGIEDVEDLLADLEQALNH